MYGDRDKAAIVTETAVFIGLLVAGSWVSIPFFPVPFTLQTLFLLLCAAVMKRFALIPATLYLLLGALGLPVFHNGTAGIGVLLGPTGGYLAGFIPAAGIAGIAYEHTVKAARIAGILLATGIILVSGAFWISISTGVPLATSLLFYALPFVPGDLLKAFAAYQIADVLERKRGTGHGW